MFLGTRGMFLADSEKQQKTDAEAAKAAEDRCKAAKSEEQYYVAKFLKLVGLDEKYNVIFQENGIDTVEILKDVSDSDFTELGVKVGDKIKIRQMISRLETAMRAKPPASGYVTTVSKSGCRVTRKVSPYEFPSSYKEAIRNEATKQAYGINS